MSKSKLAIGSVQFGLNYGVANKTGKVTQSDVKGILQFALKNGIDTIDTAIAYGDSEACLGAVGCSDFKVVTKLPAFPDDCVDVGGWAREQVSASLSRLRVKSLNGLLLHRPDQLLSSNGAQLYKALQVLKDNGIVDKVGVSIYSPNELDLLSPKYHFDLVQAPFNLVDRRIQSSGWLSRLKDSGVEVHTRSAFLQGLLLMSEMDIPVKFAPWRELWSKWHAWLDLSKLSAVQACLGFPFSFPEIDKVIVGVDGLNQLIQIVSAEQSDFCADFPDLQCQDESLINPSRWAVL